jgi:hypothetical protein
MTMKKKLTFLICVAFLVTMILPQNSEAQTRRKHRKHAGLATNLAIVGGSTAAGALVGGKKGAAIGAGGGLLYASSRRGTKRRYYNSKYRRGAKIAGGTLLGTGLGAAVGGKKGALIGAGAGAGGTYLYTRKKRNR